MDWKTCFQGKKILVVEDDSVNRDLMNDVLTQMQCQIEFANNGAEAIQKATSQSYDLIFMDLRLPDKDGIEVTKEIRNSEGPSKNIPILALTASTTDTEESMKQSGMTGLVNKPIDLEKLRQKMAEALVR